MVNHEANEDSEEQNALVRRDERQLMPTPWYGMRLPSPLPSETESVITETIGCAIAVHRALGPGFLDWIHEAQLTSYLKTTGLRAGLLMNFRAPTRQGLRRIVL